jgi:hypothetical protein
LVVGRSVADLVASRWSVTITSLSISKFLFGDLAFLLPFFFLRSFLRRGLAPYFYFIGGISFGRFCAKILKGQLRYDSDLFSGKISPHACHFWAGFFVSPLHKL